MIRAATPDDIPFVVRMGVRHLRSGGYDGTIEPDPAAIADLAHSLIGSERGLLLVSEENESVSGMIGMIAAPHPYSGALIAMEMFWYVAPEARGAGVRLMRAAEEWAKSLGLSHILMAAPDEKVAHFLERSGYRRVETNLIKRVG